MKEAHEACLSKCKQATLYYFELYLDQGDQRLKELNEEVITRVDKTRGGSSGKTKVSSHKQELFRLLNTLSTTSAHKEFEEIHEGWLRSISECLDAFPEKEIIPQHRDRFHGSDGEGFLRAIKSCKRFLFHLTRLHQYIANVFRKHKKPVIYWGHVVPVKRLAEHYFRNGLVQVWREIEERTGRIRTQLSTKLKEWEEGQWLDGAKDKPMAPEDELSAMRKDLRALMENWFEKTKEQFFRDYELVGTIEYKNRRLHSKALNEAWSTITKDWKKGWYGWQNTTHALYEDWRSDLELASLEAFATQKNENLEQSCTKWLEKLSQDHLAPINAFLKQLSREIDEADNKDLKGTLTRLQYESRKRLDQGMVAGLAQAISKNTLLNQLDRMEFELDEKIESMSEDYVVSKSGQFDRPLADSDLSSVSNNDLIAFEIQPRLESALEKVKSAMVISFGKSLATADDLDEIVSYALKTAVSALDAEDKSENDVRLIALDGLGRATQKTEELEEQLTNEIGKVQAGLREIIGNFSEDVLLLMQNENVRDIRLRISKAKALRRSEELKAAFSQRLRTYWEKSLAGIKKSIQYLGSIRDLVRDKIMPSARQVAPSRDTSNFLVESQFLINGLPLVYRRLYEIEPLTDHVLFEGRTEEMARLTEAAEAWQEGKYSSVLISGERWSGVTTMVNHFLDQFKVPVALCRHSLKSTTTTTSGLLSMLSNLLEKKGFETVEDAIEFLNDGPRRMIVLEDLQNLYLRKIHGLEAMLGLLKIVASTQKQVFWVVTLSAYARQYLEKTLRISGFFSYPVALSKLTDDQICSLVIKRNRISGFRIEFEASASNHADKKFNRLSSEERQEFLKAKFFQDLNIFARSNISMALLFWLLSTKEISEHTITIRAFEKPDLSFLSELSSDKVFSLHALILHDGLQSTQLAEVMGQDHRKMELLLLELLEDGILIRTSDGGHVVNPLVYRNVIQLLKSRNLIN